MLVLSRKTEQRIRIGDEIEVIVLAIEGDHVKIGIQAPRHITVLRYELVQDVTDENRRAAGAAAASTQIPADAMAGLGSLIGGLGRGGSQVPGGVIGGPAGPASPASRPAIRGQIPQRPGAPSGQPPRSRPTQGFRVGGAATPGGTSRPSRPPAPPRPDAKPDRT
jgi:carbon storage regulator